MLTSILNKNKSPNPYIFSNDVHATLLKYSKYILKLECNAKIQKSRYYSIYDKLVHELGFVDSMDTETLYYIVDLLSDFFNSIFSEYKYDLSGLYLSVSNKKYEYIISKTVHDEYKDERKYRCRFYTQYFFKNEYVLDKLTEKIVTNLPLGVTFVKIDLIKSVKNIVDDIINSNENEIHASLKKAYYDRDYYISKTGLSELYNSIL